MDQLRSGEFIEPKKAHQELRRWLAKHINPRDKSDKAYVGGQNVGFDIDFLAAWFENLNDPYLGSWINWRRLDSLILAHICDFLGLLPPLENFKLESLAGWLGIPLKAHDAVSDIKAARDVFFRLLGKLNVDAERFLKTGSNRQYCPRCRALTYNGESCWLCGFKKGEATQ